jgi:hypothetical protein
LAASIVVIIIIVPAAHPLVVLTVSHVSPFVDPWFAALVSNLSDDPV